MTQIAALRTIDKLGRVVLPKQMRKIMNVDQETLLCVSYDEKQNIITIKLTDKVCSACSAKEHKDNLIEIENFIICTTCAKKVAKKI